jgi:hypothetical protein
MIQIASATNRGDEQTKSAAKCGQICGDCNPNTRLGASTQQWSQLFDIKRLFSLPRIATGRLRPKAAI